MLQMELRAWKFYLWAIPQIRIYFFFFILDTKSIEFVILS